MSIRTYRELVRLRTFEDRYNYLALHGRVGEETFGVERYLNQEFYRSTQWKQVRSFVIARDDGCDLAIDGLDIFSGIVVHHMNPMAPRDIIHGDASILEPEFLISTTHRTHNAIHYGDSGLLAQPFSERFPGDTKLW